MKKPMYYCECCKRLFLQAGTDDDGDLCPACGSSWIVPVSVSIGEKNYFNTETMQMEHFCDLEQFYHDEIEQSGEYESLDDFILSCFCNNGGVLLPVSDVDIKNAIDSNKKYIIKMVFNYATETLYTYYQIVGHSGAYQFSYSKKDATQFSFRGTLEIMRNSAKLCKWYLGDYMLIEEVTE